MQEQEPDSLLNDPVGDEGDPISVDTQIVDCLVRHTTDGKEVIRPSHPSMIIMKLKFSLILQTPVLKAQS